MKIIVGIPGCWLTREAIAGEVGARTAFRLEGAKLVDRRTGRSLEVDVYDHDPRLQQAFQSASFAHPLLEADLAAIGRHTFTVYLLAPPGTANARLVLDAAAALLDVGGLGVKVETSGVAHGAVRWREFAATPEDPISLYRAFVALVGGPDDVYSCGMHNLEEPDAIVADSIARPAELVQAFLLYRLLEGAGIKAGEAFAVSEDSPRYLLRSVPCRTYPEGDLFHNPWGLWRLVPLEGTPKRRLHS